MLALVVPVGLRADRSPPGCCDAMHGTLGASLHRHQRDVVELIRRAHKPLELLLRDVLYELSDPRFEAFHLGLK